MNLAELALHLRSLGISTMKVHVNPDNFIVTVGQSSLNSSHTVSAGAPDLETATGQALALWERIQQPATEA